MATTGSEKLLLVQCRGRYYRARTMQPDASGFVQLWSLDLRVLFHASPKEVTPERKS